MKKVLIASFMILLLSPGARAQGVRLNGYAGYVFDDSFNSYYSSTSYVEGKLKGGFQWGAGLEVTPRENFGVEVLYYRQDTEAPINYYDLIARSKTLDIGVNYIMLAGNRYMKFKEKIEPYGGIMLGAAIFENKHPDPDGTSSLTKFAWGFRLGSNFWISDKVGIKIQAQLLSATQSLGGSFYVGTGGTGVGVSSYSTLYQFGLGGGLVFNLRE